MRKWHRWIALPAALFLLVVAASGVTLQAVGFFGEDEAERERLEQRPAPLRLAGAGAALSAQVARAVEAVAATHPETRDAGVLTVEVRANAEPPVVTVWTSRGFGPGGSGAARFVVDAASGDVLRVESGERESFLLRLHTGELLGDSGVVLGMLWGTALVALVLTGASLYWKMYRARVGARGWLRVFW